MEDAEEDVAIVLITGTGRGTCEGEKRPRDGGV